MTVCSIYPTYFTMFLRKVGMFAATFVHVHNFACVATCNAGIKKSKNLEVISTDFKFIFRTVTVFVLKKN